MISAKSKRGMVGTLMAALLLAAVSLSACLHLPGFEGDPNLGLERVTVIQVADGDTLVIEHEGGGQDRVRLIGIDCPDTTRPKARMPPPMSACCSPKGAASGCRRT